MKLIGILSDTHSCWDDRYRRHFEGCDEIWHAGDIGDVEILRHLQQIAPTVRAVYGNIDHGEVCRYCKKTESFHVENVKVFLTHIGGYPGHYSQGIEELLADGGFNLMVAGHSHILKVMWDKKLGLLHVNPGAAGYHGWQKERTLVRLAIDRDKIENLEVIELGKYEIDQQTLAKYD